MYYTVYKITNIVNGKIYIGSHKTKDLTDNYMGSGKYLKYAQEKYGMTNFKKEVLFIFDTSVQMYAKEAEIVNEEFLTEENTYNLKKGGSGGFDHLNDSSDDHIERCKKARSARTDYSVGGYNDKSFAKDCSARGKLVQRTQYPNGTFGGKTHSLESIEKMRESSIGKHDGDKNSQYGTRWIYSKSLNQSKKIQKTEPIPDGWVLGRKDLL